MSDYRLDVEVSQEAALRNLDMLRSKLEEVNRAGERNSTAMGRVNSSSSSAARGLSILSQTSSNAGVGMMRLEKNSASLSDSLGILTKSILSYEIAARAISASDAYLGMQNRLKLVTESEQELQIAMQDTFEISQKTGSVWSTNVQIYQRFMDVSDKLNRSQEEIGAITETIAKSVAMSGATVESANAAMVQFSQGIASGVLRGEEFNSVAEQTPALLDAIARGLNKDRSELRAMAQTGKLTTELIVGALENAAESTDAMFGQMTLGIGATFNKLRNEATKWVGEMNDASGASSALVAAMNMLAENLDGAVFIAGTAALASLTKTVLASTAATMQETQAKSLKNAITVTELQLSAANAGAIARESQARLAAAAAAVTEAQAFVANATSAKAAEMAKGVLAVREAQLTAATVANTATAAVETAATNALATATSRLAVAKQAALGLFGGGAGLIAMGVSAAAMYLLMRRNTDESAEAAQAHARFIDLDREAIEKLNSAQKDNAIDVMTESLKAQNAELKIAQSQYAGLINQIANEVRETGNTKGLQQVLSILQQVRAGTKDFASATDELNKLNFVTPEQRGQLIQAEQNYATVFKRANEAATGLKKFGEEAVVMGSKANNAALKNNILNDSLEGTKTKAEAATAAMQKYTQSMLDNIKQNAYTVARSKTTNLDQAKAEGEYYVKTGKVPSKDVQAAIAMEIAGKQQLAALEDSIKQKEKDRDQEAKERKRQNDRAAKDAERDVQDRQKEYMSFVEDARSDTQKLGDEWVIFMSRFSEFGNGDTAALERVTAAFEEKMMKAAVELTNYKETFSDYWNTEADSVNKYYQDQEMLLRKSTKVTKEERAVMREDLMKAWENELDLIKIKWDLERLESQKAFMQEKEYLEKLTELRLKQINITPDLTQDQKDIRSNAEISGYNSQTQAIDSATMNDYIGVMSGYQTTPQEQLIQSLDANREIVQAARDQGLIDQATYLDALGILDKEYFYASAEMWGQTWSSSLDGWASFFKNVQGETSSSYKAIFALQKSFSIATAALNISKAISDGWASGSTIYDKMGAVATIISQTGNILTDLSSISLGFKDGGYTGSIGKNNVAGVVHGNEFVMPAEQTSKYRGTLEAMRNGDYGQTQSGSNFYFTNHITISGGSAETTTTQTEANALGNALNAAMRQFVVDQLSQGGLISNYVKGAQNGNI